ncbi:MAG: Ig-like domain-containing protein [Paracoccaceae bacterium]
MKKCSFKALATVSAFIVPSLATAHTNSVGFLSAASAVTTCVGGPLTPCYDVEIFYGSWHNNNGLAAEGDLALFRQDGGGGETQVVGQSSPGGGAEIQFSTAHSQTGTIPNTTTTQHTYATNPSADYSNLQSVFTLGTNYFFHTQSGLAAAPGSGTNQVYAHQSAVAVGLAPGTYRIDYDGLSGVLSQNWTPTGSVGSAIFTLLPNGTVTVPSAAPPSVSLSTSATDNSSPFTVTVTFSEPVSGLSLGDFAVGNGNVSNLVMVSAGVYTVLVTPTGGPVTLDLPASTVIDVDTLPNSASNTLSLNAAPAGPTPLTPAVLTELQQLIIDEAVKDLQNQLVANQRFTRGARDRFLAARRCRQLEEERDQLGRTELELIPECEDDLVSRNNIPFDIDGSLVASSRGFDLAGKFFGQEGNYEGTHRRLVYGEFELTGYENGSVLGTLSGRVAWEKMTSDTTMLGYFLGADLTRSDINSSFSGSRDTLGLSLGAYYVEEIGEDLIGDAFIAFGVGMNNLDVGNGTVDVTSNYLTASVQAGATISGDIEYEKFTLSPEFGATYGITRIGDVGVSGTAGAVSGTDTIAAGTVSVGVLNFTPRIEIPLEINHDTYDEKQFTISPTILCQYIKSTTSSTNCGGGLELELVAKTYDGTRRVGGRIGYQSVGGSGQGNMSVFYERSF